MAALAGTVGRVGDAGDGPALVVGEAELVVNATPVGMEGSGAAGAGWLVAPSLLRAGPGGGDLVYVPRPTPWLAAAADAGATTVDGLGMLVHQAAEQLELWTGLPAPVDVMWQAAIARSPERAQAQGSGLGLVRCGRGFGVRRWEPARARPGSGPRLPLRAGRVPERHAGRARCAASRRSVRVLSVEAIKVTRTGGSVA